MPCSASTRLGSSTSSSRPKSSSRRSEADKSGPSQGRPLLNLQFHHHFPVFHLDRIDSQLCLGVIFQLSGGGVVLPPVPGTNHFAALDVALPERAAHMQADVLHGGDRAVYISDANS